MWIGKTPAILLAAVTLAWQGEAEAFFFCFNLGTGGGARAHSRRPFPPYPPPPLGAWQLPPQPYPQPVRSLTNQEPDTRHTQQSEVIEWPAAGSTSGPGREYHFRPLHRSAPTNDGLLRHSERF